MRLRLAAALGAPGVPASSLVTIIIAAGTLVHYADHLPWMSGVGQSVPWVFAHWAYLPFTLLVIAYGAWVCGLRGGVILVAYTVAMLGGHAALAPSAAERGIEVFQMFNIGVGGIGVTAAFARWSWEHALREGEKNKYRSLVEHSSEGIFLVDAGYNFLEVNHRASAITGYSRDELVGMNVRQLLLPGDSPRALPQAYQEGFGDRELSLVRKDGSEFFAYVAATVFELEGQRVAMGILRDITEERRLEGEVQTQQRELANSEQVNRAVVQHASEAIFLTDTEGNFLEVNPRACELTGYSRDDLLTMRITQFLRPDDPHQPLAQALAEGTAQRELALVRKDGSEFLAALTLTAFDLENQQVVLGIARDITEERRLQAEILAGKQALEEGYHLHFHSLGLALTARNPYTGGHGQRVRDYAMAVGRRLGLPEERISVMGIAAELHDYGKIGIPDAILLKQGPLTPPEWAEIRRHPELSVSLIEHIPFLQEAIPIIRAHHEKMDGSGYPDGLQGEAIPLESRIIGVVDAYDALTTERSYRPAYSHEEALAILRQETGSKWDPQIVQVFFQAVEDWVAPRPGEPQRQRA